MSQRALLRDHVPSAPGDDALTPPGAFPSYHVAPTVPEIPDDWKLIVSGKVGTRSRLTCPICLRCRGSTRGSATTASRAGPRSRTGAGCAISAIARSCGAKPTTYVEFRSFDAPSFYDRGYWSSWDWRRARCTRTRWSPTSMNGQPLTPAYGAPARLYGSVKLGYKMVKYLTEVNFLDVRTGGYWENKGYEWFAGV